MTAGLSSKSLQLQDFSIKNFLGILTIHQNKHPTPSSAQMSRIDCDTSG